MRLPLNPGTTDSRLRRYEPGCYQCLMHIIPQLDIQEEPVCPDRLFFLDFIFPFFFSDGRDRYTDQHVWDQAG